MIPTTDNGSDFSKTAHTQVSGREAVGRDVAQGGRPLISVVMPVFNGEKYLAEAISSILGQTWGNIELIVVNDCSTDATSAIARSFDDDRIIVLDNARNLGPAHSSNQGVLSARGDYIAKADADDICLPDRLEKQFEFMQDHPEISACFSFVDFLTEDGHPTFKKSNDKKSIKPDDIARCLLTYNCLANPTAFFRADVIKQMPYDTSLRCGEDYELWLRMVLCGHQIQIIPRSLVRYRIRSTSLSASVREDKMSRLYVDLAVKKRVFINLLSAKKKTSWQLTFTLCRSFLKYRFNKTRRSLWTYC